MSSVASVSPISGKLGFLLASHSLNNSGEFGVDGSAPVTSHLEPGVSCCQYYASAPLSKNVLHLFNCRHV